MGMKTLFKNSLKKNIIEILMFLMFLTSILRPRPVRNDGFVAGFF